MQERLNSRSFLLRALLLHFLCFKMSLPPARTWAYPSRLYPSQDNHRQGLQVPRVLPVHRPRRFGPRLQVHLLRPPQSIRMCHPLPPRTRHNNQDLRILRIPMTVTTRGTLRRPWLTTRQRDPLDPPIPEIRVLPRVQDAHRQMLAVGCELWVEYGVIICRLHFVQCCSYLSSLVPASVSIYFCSDSLSALGYFCR